jgi:type III secretion protein J
MTTTFKSHPLLKTIVNYLTLLCLCLPLLSSCAHQKTIVNGLDEKDANEILVFLSSKGISAEKVKVEAAGGGSSKEVKWDIALDASDAAEAMRLLNQQGLPRRGSKNLLDTFSNSGLVPSDLQEKIRYRAALAAELASTIRKYDGVLDADVLVSFPEEDPLNPGKMKGKITAAVWVKHSGVLDDPNTHMMSRIKRYVASGVTGLDPDDVTVIGERSRLGDVPGALEGGPAVEEKEYSRVWSVVIANESIPRFRLIFFSFSLATLILLLSLIWLLWKIVPILNNYGGVKALFSIHPLHDGHLDNESDEDTSQSEEPPPSSASKRPSTKPTINKDVDET